MNSPDSFDRLWASDADEDRERARRLAESDPVWAARLRWEERLDETARELRPEAPAGLFEEILRRYREEGDPRPQESPLRVLPVWRPPWLRASAAAALLLAAVSIGFLLRRPPAGPAPPTATPALLSDAGLARARQIEQRYAEQEEQLAVARAEPQEDPVLSPMAEQVALLDEAIAECRRALEVSSKHRHLRERLLELTRQRLQLLELLAGEA